MCRFVSGGCFISEVSNKLPLCFLFILHLFKIVCPMLQSRKFGILHVVWSWMYERLWPCLTWQKKN